MNCLFRRPAFASKSPPLQVSRLNALGWGLLGLTLVGAHDLMGAEAVAPAASQSASRPANIIVILADDLGYGTTGAYGGDKRWVRTPNLDRFAQEGAKFTDGYVTCSVCSPSRAGLMTGRYQQRFGYYANVDATKGGLPPSEKIFPQFLKSAGYATAVIGKWNLGIRVDGQHPMDRGFDEYYGFNNFQTNYFKSPILFRGREKVTEHDYLTLQFTKEAEDFIERKKDQPFFLYLAYNAVHGPDQAPEDYIARFPELPHKEAVQAAMVAALDEGVGRVMAAIKRSGNDANTLVVFLSDNGGLPTWWKGSNGVLRGLKREQWEGGDRVQFMMRWPGHIPAGQVRQELVISLDLLPTALDAAGITVPADASLDGKSLLPIFAAKEKQVVHSTLFWAGSHIRVKAAGGEVGNSAGGEGTGMDNPPPSWAVRSGQWKLMQILREGPPMLFDVDADISETTDVAALHPEIVQRLKAAFHDWFKTNGSQPIGWNAQYYEELKAVQ